MGTVAAATPQRVAYIGGTRCPQHVDKRRGVTAWYLRLRRFGEPSVRALHGESATGLAFSGQADPP